MNDKAVVVVVVVVVAMGMMAGAGPRLRGFRCVVHSITKSPPVIKPIQIVHHIGQQDNLSSRQLAQTGHKHVAREGKNRWLAISCLDSIRT